MSTWTDPREDWGVDVVGSIDFNRIEGNTGALHKGNGALTVPTVTPTSSGGDRKLDLDEVHECFKVANIAGFVSRINAAGRQPGNSVTLINGSENLSLFYETTADGNYKPFKRRGSVGEAEIVMPFQTVRLTYDGDFWYCDRAE